jgi:hypothetical protein
MGHFVALGPGLTGFMRTCFLPYSLRFLLSLPYGRYSGSAAIVKEEAIREIFSSPLHGPIISDVSLIDWRYSLWKQRQRRTSPVELPIRFLQVTSPMTRNTRGITVCDPLGVPQRQETHASYTGRRLAQHTSRRDTPRSGVARPLRDGTLLHRPGYVPPDFSEVLATPSAQVRTCTGRI